MTGGWDGALVDVGVIGWSADGWARRQLQRHGAEDTEGLIADGYGVGVGLPCDWVYL